MSKQVQETPRLGSMNETDPNETVEGEDIPTYKDISNFLYYTSSLSFFGLTVVGSCFIPDVDIIFEFVGAICVNCMAFIFPAVFYLTATNRIQKEMGSKAPPRRKFLECTAYLKLVLGTVAFCAGMFNNIYGIINGDH